MQRVWVALVAVPCAGDRPPIERSRGATGACGAMLAPWRQTSRATYRAVLVLSVACVSNRRCGQMRPS